MNQNKTLNYIIKPLDKALLILKETGIDKYIKKLTLSKFLAIMIYAQIFELSSLSSIETMLKSSSDMQKTINLESISSSQLSRKLRDINPNELSKLFHSAISEAHVHLKPNDIKSKLGNLYMIDSSTITMSMSQYPWASYKKTKSGVKLHLRLKFVDEISIPDKAVITTAKGADRKQMDKMVISEEGAINVLDRAYVDYKKFDVYCNESISFVTRLKANALIDVIEVRKVKNDSIISDEVIVLGSKYNKMKNRLRIVKTLDLNGNIIRILTNLLDKEADEIANIYRLRWKIELFFKWLKQHCRVKVFYGKSMNAVCNQIYIALIAYCLLMIVKLKESYTGTLLTCTRILKSCIFKVYDEFITQLKIKSSKTSRGRIKKTYIDDYREIWNNYDSLNLIETYTEIY
jgi:IS4 transposase